MLHLFLSTAALAGALATGPVVVDSATFNIGKGHSELVFRRGVSKPVTLTGEYLGTTGEGARQRVGFHVTGMINRLDYGVAWKQELETGGVLLGDDVDLDISVEAVRVPSGA